MESEKLVAGSIKDGFATPWRGWGGKGRLGMIYLREGGNNLGIGKLERTANLVVWTEEAFGTGTPG